MQNAGYRIGQLPTSVYGNDNELARFLAVVAPYTMLPLERLISLYDQARFCEREGVEGAFVECGVWKGGAVGLMALAAGGSDGTRQLHLFDAFTDICEPDSDVDGARAVRETKRVGGANGASGRLQPLDGFYDKVGGHGTLEGCVDLLQKRIGYPANRVQYHVGWFQDTLPEAAPKIGPIAILRLDGDWYASTKVCLEHLFNSVVKGGIVIIDDYGTYEGCQRAVDEFLTARGLKAYLHQVDTGCHYFVKAAA